jgi:AAA+ ATPase superfamily predicted ATPase
MNYLVRELSKNIVKKLQPNKVVMVLGARRVGKTVLVKEILDQLHEPVLTLNGDDINVHDQLAIRSVENYKQMLGSYKILYIDEAQKIPEIGLKLKLMIDEIEDLKIIISGSSSFDIRLLYKNGISWKKSVVLVMFSIYQNPNDMLATLLDELSKEFPTYRRSCLKNLLLLTLGMLDNQTVCLNKIKVSIR